jgi:IS30 family transposase
MNYTRLTLTEREEISRGFAVSMSLRQIADSLARPPSTISRELSRLRYHPASYRAIFAHDVALRRRNHRRGDAKLLNHELLRQYVVDHLRLGWSPQQIEARLKIEYPNDMTMRVSHETIYTYVYCLARGSLKKELISCLRQKRYNRRHSRVSAIRRATLITDLTSISERPKEVEDRIIPGHWEGNLIVGANHATALGTLVERTTRTVILVPLKAKDALSVAEAFACELETLPEQMKLTLTYDRGSEMARHKLFSERTNMKVYFADPYSPWQRGTNENTNGLIRQYFPRGMSFRNVTVDEIKHVQDLLNGRPRKALNFKTPYEAFNLLLAEKGEVVPGNAYVALDG